MAVSAAFVCCTRKEVAVLFADFSLDWLPPILNILIMLLGVFLILLVLIQRGKGGGLAGAFGGVGGSSAFGSRAGDQFTRITLVTAAIWVLLIMLMAKIIQPPQARDTAPAVDVPAGPPQTRLWLPDSQTGEPRQNAALSSRSVRIPLADSGL
jgi:preprotein translocase subunit SecG